MFVFSSHVMHLGSRVHILQNLDTVDLAMVHCWWSQCQWGEGGQETETETQESIHALMPTNKHHLILDSQFYSHACWSDKSVGQYWYVLSSFPGLSCFILWFAFSTIHGSREEPLFCIHMLYWTQTEEHKWGALGTRLGIYAWRLFVTNLIMSLE